MPITFGPTDGHYHAPAVVNALSSYHGSGDGPGPVGDALDPRLAALVQNPGAGLPGFDLQDQTPVPQGTYFHYKFAGTTPGHPQPGSTVGQDIEINTGERGFTIETTVAAPGVPRTMESLEGTFNPATQTQATTYDELFLP